jgi:hypothetical protein
MAIRGNPFGHNRPFNRSEEMFSSCSTQGMKAPVSIFWTLQGAKFDLSPAYRRKKASPRQNRVLQLQSQVVVMPPTANRYL